LVADRGDRSDSGDYMRTSLYKTIAGVIFGPQTHIKEIAILIQSIVREISLLHSKQSYICITHNDLSLQFARQHGNKRNIYEEQSLYFRFSCVSKFTSLISKVSIYVIWFSQHHQKGICPDKIQEKYIACHVVSSVTLTSDSLVEPTASELGRKCLTRNRRM